MAEKRSSKASKDEDDLGEISPGRDAAIFRRAGLTEAEANRLAAIEALREETPSPWEAQPLGALGYWLWRGLVRGLQPLWLLASLLAAAWFLSRIIASQGGLEALDPQTGLDEDRIRARIAALVPDGVMPRDYWNAQLTETLAGDWRRRPDLARFDVWVAAGPDLIGRDAIALRRLAGDADPSAMDARLIAGPPQARRRALDAAYDEAMLEADHAGLDPRALYFVDAALQDQRAQSAFTWSIADTSLRRFLSGEQTGQLELGSLPGVLEAPREGSRVYGGVRTLAVQVCAVARERRLPFEGCEDRVIPRASADLTELSLVAFEAGLVRAPGSLEAQRRGAQIIRLSRRAGHVDPALETYMAAVFARDLPPDQLLAALAGQSFRADLAFAAPARAEGALNVMVEPEAGSDLAQLSDLFRDLDNGLSAVSPLLGLRLAGQVASPADAALLNALFEEAGPRAAVLIEAEGGAALEVLTEEVRISQPDRADLHGLYAALMSAFIVLCLTFARRMTPPLIRQASRFQAVDARVSRLLLGKKL